MYIEVVANSRRDKDGFAWIMVADRHGNSYIPTALTLRLDRAGIEYKLDHGTYFGAKCAPVTLLNILSDVFTGHPHNLSLRSISDEITSTSCGEVGPTLHLGLDTSK